VRTLSFRYRGFGPNPAETTTWSERREGIGEEVNIAE